MSTERKLAAILVADVVGYSRLMGSDEEATLRDFAAHLLAVINPTIGQYHGRVVKQMGDGLLVEYPSVVDAVKCAIAIQEGMVLRNRDVPEERKIRFRIGVNLGDVLVEGDDIFGDGVNIAARLQEKSAADGVCISSAVFGHVEGAIDQEFSDGGAHHFKNISKAVRVYQFSARAADSAVKVAFRPFVDISGQKAAVAAGGCLCGNVRYEVTGDPLGSMLCHCRMCQRFSGAPILEGTTFASDGFRLLKGEPKFYQSSEIAKRGFCGDCGAPMIYQGIIGSWVNWIVITTGSFDEPWRFPPTYHLGTESSLPWLKVVDDLPRTQCKDSPSLVEAYRSVGKDVP